MTTIALQQPTNWTTHDDWLRGVARRMLPDRSAADDMVQRTWLAVLTCSNPRLVQPWLRKVLRNTITRSWHESRIRSEREMDCVSEQLEASASELASKKESHARVNMALAEVPEPLHTTLVLRFYKGLSSTQIAERMQVPAGTVRWRVKRGLEVLRGRYQASDHSDRSPAAGELAVQG